MRRTWIAAAAVLAALPATTQAQTLQYPGFYIGAEGGLNWMFNTSSTATFSVPGIGFGSGTVNAYPALGWAAGGMIGYDFVGPRVELEGVYRDNKATLTAPGFAGSIGADFNNVAVMANLFYDFNAGGTIVPYIGAGAGVAFTNSSALGGQSSSTQFAYQGIIGVGLLPRNGTSLKVRVSAILSFEGARNGTKGLHA